MATTGPAAAASTRARSGRLRPGAGAGGRAARPPAGAGAGAGGAPRRAAGRSGAKKRGEEVGYGTNWYEQTRAGGTARRRTDRQILEAWKKANVGKDRRDLYTEKWDGDVYKGSGFNILNLLVLLFFLVPAVGILVAYKGYGVWWG